jgi:hypothetical protein
VQIGCACVNNYMHRTKCAHTWFLQKMSVVFMQYRDESAETGKLMNRWSPSVNIKCEVCNVPLSKSFCQTLLEEVAKVDDTAKQVLHSMTNHEIVALKVARVPKPGTSVNTAVRNKGGGMVRTTRTLTAADVADFEPTDREFRQVGKRSEPTTGVSTPQDPGSWSGKEVRVWHEIYGDQNSKGFWTRGEVHEYISAEDRNKCTKCKKQCSCKKHSRGMYRFTIPRPSRRHINEGFKVDDYFSDGDDTVELV